jgi:hydroxyacylglutathione hydrolase
MAKVCEGVYYIMGQDEFIPDSHTYVIGDPASGDLSLIDVGLAGKGRYKVDSLRKLGLDPSSVKRIIMTHTHMDHIGCVPEVMAEIPGVELWVHRLEAEPLEKGDDRTVYGMDMFKSMVQMQYKIKPDAYKLTVHRKIEGGDTLQIGGMEWEVIHIPGHSMGGIALYHRPQKVLIPGDVIYADLAIGRFDLHGADPGALRDSLYRLAEYDIEFLLPGHNNLVKALPKDYVMKVAKTWEPYLR